MREYMCVADDPKKKLFTRDMFKVEPRERVWQPTFAFFDPARTVKLTSATTGWAVWSWVGNRLIVWDGGGGFWKPDEIVDRVFKVDEKYRPVAIGVETDGLHEFLEQPLRQEQIRRGYLLPFRPMKAPKGKLDFIASLQPFFVSGEVTFARPIPELETQFLNYPSGKIDGPNALAYALLMRPGQVIYDGFGADNVVDAVSARDRLPCYLCLNARSGYTTGILVQFNAGVLSVVADYVQEGDPGNAVAAIIRAATLEAGQQVRPVSGPEHYSNYNHLGLRGAVAKVPAELRRGVLPEVGRKELRELFSRRVRDRAAVQVSLNARWTINALASGFCYEIGKSGMLGSEPRDGPYRCLIEGLEAFTGLISQSSMNDHGRPNVQYTASGQRYVSALPGKGTPDESKDSYLTGRSVH